jgi:zinc transport system substrate-binding protein
MNQVVIKITYWMLLLFFTLPGLEKLYAAEKLHQPIKVFVSILPQAYFVERIGGNRVSVDVLVAPGKSPATYAPTPGQMSRLAKAELFFRIGVPFEKVLIPKVEKSSKNIKIVDTRKGIKLRRVAGGRHHGIVEDNHQKAGGNDPHIWLSPVLVKRQAETICEALIQFDPERKSEYTSNLKDFTADLDILHRKISNTLAPLKGSTIFVFHPVFGYFVDEYGLRQIAVELEGKAPKGKDFSSFIKKARQQNVHVVFVQPQFDLRTARKIANAIDGVVVSVDPLDRDYISSLNRITEKVAEALKK